MNKEDLVGLVKLQVENIAIDFGNLEPADKVTALNYIKEKLYGTTGYENLKSDYQISEIKVEGRSKRTTPPADEGEGAVRGGLHHPPAGRPQRAAKPPPLRPPRGPQ